jgi:hypothetical protein
VVADKVLMDEESETELLEEGEEAIGTGRYGDSSGGINVVVVYIGMVDVTTLVYPEAGQLVTSAAQLVIV